MPITRSGEPPGANSHEDDSGVNGINLAIGQLAAPDASQSIGSTHEGRLNRVSRAVHTVFQLQESLSELFR